MIATKRLVSSLVAATALLSVAGSLALLAPAAGAKGSAARVYVAAKGCIGRAYKPTKLVLACADANLYVTGLKFSSYGASTAKATGTIHENQCKPNCAAGKFATHPATIVLTDVVKCSDGNAYYAKAKYSFKAKHGKGTEDIAPTRLTCKAG
ncbi:MAG: hypothetical protein ACYCU0_13175 [Solirubrobacteraceae bacterium]